MKNTIISSLLMLLMLGSAIALNGQSSDITITERGLLIKNKIYTKCDIEMTQNQLLSVFSKDPAMKVYIKPMTLNFAASSILKSTASLLILWPVTESFYDNTTPNWNLAYIGAGCAILAIPFSRAFDKHAAKGVQYYNSAGKKTSAIDINFGPGSNGMGIVMTF